MSTTSRKRYRDEDLRVDNVIYNEAQIRQVGIRRRMDDSRNKFRIRMDDKVDPDEMMEQIANERSYEISDTFKEDKDYVPTYWEYMQKPYNWYKTFVERKMMNEKNTYILGDKFISRYGIGNNLIVNLVEQNGDYVVDLRRLYHGMPTKIGIQVSYKNLEKIMDKYKQIVHSEENDGW